MYKIYIKIAHTKGYVCGRLKFKKRLNIYVYDP